MESLGSACEASADTAKPAELDSATFTCCGAASEATSLNEPQLLAEAGCTTDPDPADSQRGHGPPTRCVGAEAEAEAEGGVRQHRGSCETHDCCLLVGVSVSSDLTKAPSSSGPSGSPSPEASTQVSPTALLDRRVKSATVCFEVPPAVAVEDTDSLAAAEAARSASSTETHDDAAPPWLGTTDHGLEAVTASDTTASSTASSPPVSSLQLPPVRMLRDDQLFFARVTATEGRHGRDKGKGVAVGGAGPGEALYQVLVQGAVLSRSIQVQTSPSLQRPAQHEEPAGTQRRARKVQTDWVAVSSWVHPQPLITSRPHRRNRTARPTSAPPEARWPSAALPSPVPAPPAAHQKCFSDQPPGAVSTAGAAARRRPRPARTTPPGLSRPSTSRP